MYDALDVVLLAVIFVTAEIILRRYWKRWHGSR